MAQQSLHPGGSSAAPPTPTLTPVPRAPHLPSRSEQLGAAAGQGLAGAAAHDQEQREEPSTPPPRPRRRARAREHARPQPAPRDQPPTGREGGRAGGGADGSQSPGSTLESQGHPAADVPADQGWERPPGKDSPRRTWGTTHRGRQGGPSPRGATGGRGRGPPTGGGTALKGDLCPLPPGPFPPPPCAKVRPSPRTRSRAPGSFPDTAPTWGPPAATRLANRCGRTGDPPSKSVGTTPRRVWLSG